MDFYHSIRSCTIVTALHIKAQTYLSFLNCFNCMHQAPKYECHIDIIHFNKENSKCARNLFSSCFERV